MLEGRKDPGKMSGFTNISVSEFTPRISVEIEALYFIRSINYGRWYNCQCIALLDLKMTFSSIFAARFE